MPDLLSEFKAIGGRVPSRTKSATVKAMNVITENTKKFIPAGHRLAPQQRALETSTGRLWSGFGVADETGRHIQARRTLRRSTIESNFGKDDNLAILYNHGSKFEFDVGTNVPYARYVNIGHNPLSGRYTPFYYFMEIGLQVSEDELNEIYQSEMIDAFDYVDPKQYLMEKNLRTSALRRQNTRQQTRTYGKGFGGRFGSKVATGTIKEVKGKRPR